MSDLHTIRACSAYTISRLSWGMRCRVLWQVLRGQPVTLPAGMISQVLPVTVGQVLLEAWGAGGTTGGGGGGGPLVDGSGYTTGGPSRSADDDTAGGGGGYRTGPPLFPPPVYPPPAEHHEHPGTP